MTDAAWDAHMRAGVHLGGDHYANLEYLLSDGTMKSYPAGQGPEEEGAPLIGLMEHHKRPDGGWCGGWVGFKNVPGADERAKHELVSSDPLTVAPSLACRQCPSHGFIRDGRWADA